MTHTRTHRRSFCGPDAGYAIEQSIIIIFRRDLNNWFNLTIVYLLFFFVVVLRLICTLSMYFQSIFGQSS